MRQARHPRRLKDIGLSSYARMLCASSLLGNILPRARLLLKCSGLIAYVFMLSLLAIQLIPPNVIDRYVHFPMWLPRIVGLLFTAFLVGAVLWMFARLDHLLLSWLDQRRFTDKQCQRCGYLLIGNTSGVCPECGERV